MYAIRDSQEPEDPLEDADMFTVSPTAPATDPTPISFDLPSTTSAATQPPSSTSIPTQKPKTPVNPKKKPPKRRRTIDDEGVDDEHESMWEFPNDTPARNTRRSRTMVETSYDVNEVEESPVTRKSTRRNSLSIVSEIVVKGRDTRQSPIIKNGYKKRRPSRRIEESDTEEIESAIPDTLADNEEVSQLITLGDARESRFAIDEVIVIDSSPRKRAIAVEIPVKSARRSKDKKPLKEIVVDNIPPPDPSPTKPSIQPQEPPALAEAREELENVVLANVPSTPSRETVTEAVKRTEMSPPRQMNVASILAKSPHRPAYRVGLSKRANVEPLHGYLKRKAQ